MVGVLWSQKSFTAAIALEALWNTLIDSIGFDIFCGYPIDVLSEDFQLACVHSLLDSHTRVVPAVAHNFDNAIRQAMDDVLGNHNDGLRSLTLARLAKLDTVRADGRTDDSPFAQHAAALCRRDPCQSAGVLSGMRDGENGADVRAETRQYLDAQLRAQASDQPESAAAFGQ